MNREKQIDIIEDLLIDFDEMGFAPTTVGPDPEAYAKEWKDKLISAFEGYRKQSEGEWVSVDDRLPEESCECLTVDRFGVVLQVSYSGRHRAFNASDEDDGDKWKVGGVTHWMPLPKPPKMKGGTE